MQLYVKYNGVLRGLNSDSDFLKKAMVRLCCPKEVSDKYTAGVIPLSHIDALPPLQLVTSELGALQLVTS